jgi:hypothetical protein
MKCLVYSLRLVVIVGTIQTSACLADNVANLESRIDSIMNNHKQNRPVKGLTDQELNTADANDLLRILGAYEDDQAWVVRRLSCWYQYRLAKLQPEPKVREQVVKRLIRASVSKGVKQANKWLLTFTAKDFNEHSKQLIREALKKEKVNRWHVLLCGVADMKEQLPFLGKLLIDELNHQAKEQRGEEGFDWYYTTGWAARLARARMGVQSDIKKCLELEETVEDLDRRVRRLLPDVGYIRQPQAIQYLQRYLESDKRLLPVKPTVQGELYANRAMRILVGSLRNFPIAKKETHSYTLEEIETARKWMREQKPWNIIR